MATNLNPNFLLSGDDDRTVVESYSRRGTQLVRTVLRRDGSTNASVVVASSKDKTDLARAYDQSWLRSSRFPLDGRATEAVRVVDLFSGCGAMSLGVAEACRALGYSFDPVLAVEFDAEKAAIYGRNFPGAAVVATPVEVLFDGDVGDPLSNTEKSGRRSARRVDILLGGPPCQGHSDLNNHTRRRDDRNQLYLRMVRAAEVLRPRHVLIENVPGVRHDRLGVFQRSVQSLQSLGYVTNVITLQGEWLGIAQRRRRTFLVASRTQIHLEHRAFEVQNPRTFSWACGDLRVDSSILNSAAKPTAQNTDRINFLFENDLFDLPNNLRPACHRDKEHSYKSMYGRLRSDCPAQTITTGFGSMGQGRFVHPTQRRTITPHEAARLQFLPDFFELDASRRGVIAEVIGNAVPPKMSYVLALSLLR